MLEILDERAAKRLQPPPTDWMVAYGPAGRRSARISDDAALGSIPVGRVAFRFGVSLMPEQRSDIEIALDNAREELNLKDEALAVVVEDRDRQWAEIQRLRTAGRSLRSVARRPVESSIQVIDAAIKQWDEAEGTRS